MPAGVGLMAQNGSRATLTGGTAQEPTVTLGDGAQLALVDVVDAAGVAVAIRAANAVVSNVNVSGAKSAALAVLCRETATPGCAPGSSRSRTSCSRRAASASGSRARTSAGRAERARATRALRSRRRPASSRRTAPSSISRTSRSRRTRASGVLVDGALTTASIKNATVNENGERGIWAQRVNGTLDAPAVKIEGSQITKNKIVGVGAMESRGIIIVSGRIADTVAAPLVTNLETSEQVGDGVGIFANSGDFKIDGSLFETNARAAGVIDGSERGIIIVSGKVGSGGSGLKFVVQNSKGADVQIADADPLDAAEGARRQRAEARAPAGALNEAQRTPITVRTSISSGKKAWSSARFRKRDARGAARAGLVADDALDGLHVTEPPELEALLDVEELLAHLVGVPPREVSS